MPPPLTTARLTLIRLIDASDAQLDALVAAWDDPEVFRYVGVGRTGFTHEYLARGLARFRELYAVHQWGPLLVVRTSDGAVLGETGLYPAMDEGVDTGEIELGHRYGRAYWGQGYGFEAASVVMGWAVELGLTELVSIIQEGNIASRRIAERLGFTLRETKATSYANVLWYSWRSRTPAGG